MMGTSRGSYENYRQLGFLSKHPGIGTAWELVRKALSGSWTYRINIFILITSS